MNVYMVTNDSGSLCCLIGIFDSRRKAEFARREYITEHERWDSLESSLERYIEKVTDLLEKGYIKGEINTKTREILALSYEDRYNWWLGINYKIRKIELNTVIDEMLYAEFINV